MQELVCATERTKDVHRRRHAASGGLKQARVGAISPLYEWRPRVRIYRPARTPTQAGRAKTRHWVIEFEPLDAPEPDPLMGWIGFPSQKAALDFTLRQGWDGTVYQPHDPKVRPKRYADNFLGPKASGGPLLVRQAA